MYFGSAFVRYHLQCFGTTIAEFTETGEAPTLAVRALNEDVMATKQQVKTQVTAAINKLLSTRNAAARYEVTPDSIQISPQLTTRYTVDKSPYLKLSGKNEQPKCNA